MIGSVMNTKECLVFRFGCSNAMATAKVFHSVVNQKIKSYGPNNYYSPCYVLDLNSFKKYSLEGAAMGFTGLYVEVVCSLLNRHPLFYHQIFFLSIANMIRNNFLILYYLGVCCMVLYSYLCTGIHFMPNFLFQLMC